MGRRDGSGREGSVGVEGDVGGGGEGNGHETKTRMLDEIVCPTSTGNFFLEIFVVVATWSCRPTISHLTLLCLTLPFLTSPYLTSPYRTEEYAKLGLNLPTG